MQFYIKKSFEDYITLSFLKEFEIKNGLKLKAVGIKDKIREIELNVNDGNLSGKVVNHWINDLIKQGEKTILFGEYNTKLFKIENLKLNDTENFFNATSLNETVEVQYCISTSPAGTTLNQLEIGLGIKLYIEENFKFIPYSLPIIVEIDLKKNNLKILFRPKKKLSYNQNVIDRLKVTESNLLERIAKCLEEEFNIFIIGNAYTKDKYRKAIYKILEESAGLPDKVKAVLDSYDGKDIDLFIESITSQFQVSEELVLLLQEDLNNLIEKYICLSWDNSADFIMGRKCYPYNIALKDCEDTTIIQKNDMNESLLIKTAYHDNKKTLRKQKMLNSVHMTHTEDKDTFRVIYGITKNLAKISISKNLRRDEMNSVIDTFITKYYE